MAALAAAIDADAGNTSREVIRLERGGVLASRRVGRTKLVRVNRDAPFYRPLYDLVAVVLGPVSVLAERLQPDGSREPASQAQERCGVSAPGALASVEESHVRVLSTNR